MPSIDYNTLKQIKSDLTVYKNFVETGTYFGETIFGMEPYFERLYTIEIDEKLHYSTKSKYNGNKINFILGDGYKVISELVSIFDAPTIFFLDGHHSGPGTGKGEKDCPLYEEFQVINDKFKSECIIIVDDFRLFEKDPSSGILGEDWSEINKSTLLEIVKSRVLDSYHLPSFMADDDRLIVHLSAK